MKSGFEGKTLPSKTLLFHWLKIGPIRRQESFDWLKFNQSDVSKKRWRILFFWGSKNDFISFSTFLCFFCCFFVVGKLVQLSIFHLFAESFQKQSSFLEFLKRSSFFSFIHLFWSSFAQRMNPFVIWSSKNDLRC